MLCGIPFYSKSLLYKVPSKWRKKWRGESFGPPQKWKQSEGTFIKQAFEVKMDPAKHWKKKLHFRGELQKLAFYVFKKKLKGKNDYLGDFSAKNEKNDYVFRKEMKSLLYKSVLRFSKKCLDKKS